MSRSCVASVVLPSRETSRFRPTDDSRRTDGLAEHVLLAAGNKRAEIGAAGTDNLQATAQDRGRIGEAAARDP